MQKTHLGRASLAYSAFQNLLPFLLIPYVAFNVFASFPRDDRLNDALVFLASGRAVANGSNPYYIQEGLFSGVMGKVSPSLPNLNPPISLILFQPLSYFDQSVVLWLWYGLSIAFYVVTIFLLAKFYKKNSLRRMLWALGLSGLWSTLFYGQIYPPLVLAGVGAWLLLDRQKQLPAGLLIGIVAAFKPNFLIWPILLLAGGYWLPTLVALTTFALLSLPPLIVYGPHIYADWLDATARSNDLMPSALNSSLWGLFARLDAPFLGVAVSAVLVLVLVVWIWARRGRKALTPIAVSKLALPASLIASPLAWPGYSLFLLPIYFDGTWSIPMVLSALVLLVPTLSLAPEVRTVTALTIGSVYTYGLVFLCVSLVREQLGPMSSTQ